MDEENRGRKEIREGGRKPERRGQKKREGIDRVMGNP